METQLKKAVIIANGAQCSETLLLATIADASYVLILDSALEKYIKISNIFHGVAGDFDRNFDPHSVIGDLNGIEIYSTPDQNKTDLEKGIELLLAKGYEEIDVLWATGKRMDHTFNNISSLVYFKGVNIKIIDDYSIVYVLEKHFEKAFQKGAIISLMPIGLVEGIATQNLKYPLHNESLELGVRSGSSNEVAEDGKIKITHCSGNLILMECND